jgi:dihydroorotate dehydrogenase
LIYRAFFHLVLRWLPAETAHHLAFFALRFLLVIPGLAWLTARLLRPAAPELRVRALGLEFPGPVGMAAGFDKDARVYEALGALGFGHVEIGTVTGQAQPGNPRPRLFRLPADHALLNRMGFNNEGARSAAGRLGGKRSVPIGVNIGKTKLVPAEEAASDYVASAELLAPLADYFVVNVSSPNTPGLRDLQAVDKLAPLLQEVRGALDRASPTRRVPLLVKIAPDLADADIDAVTDMAIELGLDGMVLCNTTLSRSGLRTPAAKVEALGAGGLSGRPLRQRSLAILRQVKARAGERLVLISVGGIDSAEDVLERLRAGATLVQLYSAFVYGGPLLVWSIQRKLVRLMRGVASAGPEAASAPLR